MSSSGQGRLGSTGSGRILCWRGGSIWMGKGQNSTEMHSHHAIQITFSISTGKVFFQSPDQDWKAYSAAAVPAHLPHAFNANGEYVGVLFVEPESAAGRSLNLGFVDGISSLSAELSKAGIDALRRAFVEKYSDQELIGCSQTLAAELAATTPHPTKVLDQRVDRAIALIQEQLGQTINLSDIAEAVHLSPERFRHLFIEQTGIRFRPYVLWLRLGTSLSLYVSGATLTEAAYAGGFADSAHFSRTFKRMFGLPPISITPE